MHPRHVRQRRRSGCDCGALRHRQREGAIRDRAEGRAGHVVAWLLHRHCDPAVGSPAADGRRVEMAKPAAPGLRINRFAAGRWSEAPDAVVTEEPLQLLLDGEPLAVVMRTPGADIELAFGLLFAEGVIRSRSDVRAIRISAESAESEERIAVEPVLMESNHVDVKLAVKPQRKPERSMLASSACGVCGTQMIDDLRHDLAALPSGPRFDPSTLPGLVDRLRSGQGVFDRTGGLHAAGLFDATGEIVALREDIGRHNAVDKWWGGFCSTVVCPLQTCCSSSAAARVTKSFRSRSARASRCWPRSARRPAWPSRWRESSTRRWSGSYVEIGSTCIQILIG